MRIVFPLYPTIRFARSIVKKCQEARVTDEPNIIFDLSRCTFVFPFGVTLRAGAMRECAERGHKVEYILPSARKPREFLESVGFEEFGESQPGSAKFVGKQVRLRLLTAVDPSYSDDVLQVLRSYIKM